MSILLFFGVLFVLILVHEWGHYIVAKKTDMQVDEFGIGFPPKLYGKKIGETEYTLNALPIGGFVRILGEDAVGADATGARARSFIAKSYWAQAAVLIAGVTMNIIFAWFLFALVFFVGVPTLVDEEQAGPDAALIVTQLLPEGPAETAGLPLGATIDSVTVGGETIVAITPSAFRTITESSSGDITVTYHMGEEQGMVILTPIAGLIADDQNRPAVGVGLSMSEVERSSFFGSMQKAAVTTGSSLVAITKGLGQLLVGQADLKAVAGPIGIAGMVGDAAQIGFATLLMFTAIISLNLAVINMLPFPALDGGRLLFVAIEAVTRRPINPVWVMRLNTLGFILLMFLMVIVTFSDIRKLFF